MRSSSPGVVAIVVASATVPRERPRQSFEPLVRRRAISVLPRGPSYFRPRAGARVRVIADRLPRCRIHCPRPAWHAGDLRVSRQAVRGTDAVQLQQPSGGEGGSRRTIPVRPGSAGRRSQGRRRPGSSRPARGFTSTMPSPHRVSGSGTMNASGGQGQRAQKELQPGSPSTQRRPEQTAVVEAEAPEQSAGPPAAIFLPRPASQAEDALRPVMPCFILQARDHS